jgi:hypothetical protein
MAYFSNGSEGDRFQAEYCDRCVHWNPEKGCPIFDAHLLFNYQECDSGSNAEMILNMLIPEIENEHGTFPGECSMFHNAHCCQTSSDKRMVETWIPFPQVLPDAARKYLCWVEGTPYGDRHEVREWSWTNEFWEGRTSNERVTFYMPLPDPPTLCSEVDAINRVLNAARCQTRSDQRMADG